MESYPGFQNDALWQLTVKQASLIYLKLLLEALCWLYHCCYLGITCGARQTKFCKLGWFYQNTYHSSQMTHPNCKKKLYVLQNEALQPKLHIALSNVCTQWHTLNSFHFFSFIFFRFYTSFILTNFCLTNYTLSGMMKSTLILCKLCHNTKIVQIVENSSEFLWKKMWQCEKLQSPSSLSHCEPMVDDMIN